MAQPLELPGAVLEGVYTLVNRTEESLGQVFEAQHDRLPGRFTVRLFPPEVPGPPFRRAAQLASALRHPGIVQVLDFNWSPGAIPFVVMESLDGKPLSKVIAESGRGLPLPR